MAMSEPVGRQTAYSALLAASDSEHVTHSVARKGQVRGDIIKLRCSCGRVFSLVATGGSLVALRNVPEEATL